MRARIVTIEIFFGFCLGSWNSTPYFILWYIWETIIALPAITSIISTLLYYHLTFFFVMNSQPSYERKPQPSSLPSFQKVNKQRAATWFSKPSFFRFKSKPSFLSHSPKSSHSSLSSDPSLSRARSPSTITTTSSSKDSIIYASSSNVSSSNQESLAIKKSSRVRQTLDAVSSTFAIYSSSTPIHSTAPQTTPDYRQPIPKIFSAVPMVPGVCSLAFTWIPLDPDFYLSCLC